MSIALGIALYFVIWWMTLFAVLPFGGRTQGESGHVVPGTPESAHMLIWLMSDTPRDLYIRSPDRALAIRTPRMANDHYANRQVKRVIKTGRS